MQSSNAIRIELLSFPGHLESEPVGRPDSRTLAVEPVNERCHRAVKMRLDCMPLRDYGVQFDLSRTTVIVAVKAVQA